MQRKAPGSGRACVMKHEWPLSGQPCGAGFVQLTGPLCVSGTQKNGKPAGSRRPKRGNRKKPKAQKLKANAIRIIRGLAWTLAHLITTAKAEAETDRITRAKSRSSVKTTTVLTLMATASAVSPTERE